MNWSESFKCGQCNKCCQYPTVVTFKAEEKNKFDRDFPEIKVKYHLNHQNSYEIVLKENEKCPFLVNEGCIQHLKFGFAYKSECCKQFPFITPERASFYCSEVVKNPWINDAYVTSSPQIQRIINILKSHKSWNDKWKEFVFEQSIASDIFLNSQLCRLAFLSLLFGKQKFTLIKQIPYFWNHHQLKDFPYASKVMPFERQSNEIDFLMLEKIMMKYLMSKITLGFLEREEGFLIAKTKLVLAIEMSYLLSFKLGKNFGIQGFEYYLGLLDQVLVESYQAIQSPWVWYFLSKIMVRKNQLVQASLVFQ